MVAVPTAPRLSTLDSFRMHPVTVIGCEVVATFSWSLVSVGDAVGGGEFCWAGACAETMRLTTQPTAKELDSNFGLMSHLRDTSVGIYTAALATRKKIQKKSSWCEDATRTPTCSATCTPDWSDLKRRARLTDQ